MMSKLDVIDNLRQRLEKLKSITAELDIELSEVTRFIETGEFIPELLSNNIIDGLSKINTVQKELENQYVSLGEGAFPCKIDRVYELVDKCSKKLEKAAGYIDAISFFMSLESDDESIQELLDSRKEKLSSIDFETIDVDSLKEIAECYVWLSDAFHETDQVQKFSLIYKLSGSFEEPIARGVQFGLLKPAEEGLSITKDDTGLSTDGEDVWKPLGIENFETLIFKEDKSLLNIEMSSKASVKFGVKEFKKDIVRQAPAEKIACLKEAVDGCGYSKESIAVWKKREKGYYDYATEKLLQQGYLKKYAVKGFGEFFTLSPRGEKAFTYRDSLAFINNHSRKKNNIKICGEHVEDSANSAITRILCQSCFARTLRINGNYTFWSRTFYMDTDYFFVKFPEVLGKKDIAYFGITSEAPEQFKEAYEYLAEKEEGAQYIVMAATHELACAISKWVLKIMGNRLQVWYCGYEDNGFFDSDTDAVIDIETAGTSSDDSADRNNTPDETEPRQITEGIVEAQEIKQASAEEAKEVCEEVSVSKPAAIVKSTLSEAEKIKYTEEYQKMLISGKFYGATAYVKALSAEIPYFEPIYRQLAYALNDPMCSCSYSSNTIFNVFYNEENLISDYFVIAAAIRNYFYDQFSYDYYLQQLQAMVSGNEVLGEDNLIDNIVYTLYQFKNDNHRGIDRYADYREKERASWEIRLEENRREAEGYYNNYCARNLKENASHKRFIETEKLLFGVSSELSEYLQVVIKDEREMLDLLEGFLVQYYVKDQAAICKENIEPAKIDVVLNKYWDMAAQNMRLVKKSSDLMSSLRMNLFKRVKKIVSVLCDYVFLIRSAIPNGNEPAFREYKKVRTTLLDEINKAIEKLEDIKKTDFSTLAGKAVLVGTLHEMKARMEGSYKEGNNKYFYIRFLRNDKVLLDDDFFPVLDNVSELPEFSICNRIVEHCEEAESEWEERLNKIFSGGDDYGSAELILKFLSAQDITFEKSDYQSFSVEKAVVFAQRDMENRRAEFIEDLELAQSYGQIDNTVENTKETMIQVMETWYGWANETRNYGFFAKILEKFREKIRKDAQIRAVELDGSLTVYMEKNPDWSNDELIARAVEEIRDRIARQNYAAAEDLLNRLITNDLDFEVDLQQVDYLSQFLNEYEVNYRRTANPATTLKSLVYTSKINKDTKGADKLLGSWPRGAGVGENTLKVLLQTLGFNVNKIKAEVPLQGKIESCLVTLKRPQNGRKSNYKHPISAFGSEAEDKGFRVVCIFGKSDASRLIDTFKEIGNAKNTLVLLDYALTVADRRTLARKTKTDLTGKIFAVIDRVVLVYLAKNYTETAINRILMSVIMPFASYQPYIAKSADVMPPEIFIGRKNELEQIESPTGVNIVYGGRQLGKTALLRMAKKDIDMDENGDRAIIVDAWNKDYRATAKAISEILYDEGILKKENITEDWNELARDIKNRLRDTIDPIPYFLLMIDEADVFIDSCESVDYQPFSVLKDIQSIGFGRFKFVVAGLRNIVRFKRTAALSNNIVLPHLASLTVKPFKSMEARELLEVPLSYLGFRFPDDNETEVLVSTIFGTTNYFPGLIQLYCAKLIGAVRRDYAGYSESETPPYYVQKEHIKKVLAEQTLQHDIREKFIITLKVGEDDYYFIIALLVAYHYHENKSQNGCCAKDILYLANAFSIGKLTTLGEEKVTALMEEMRELNVLQHNGDGRYRFARHSFCQMMGNVQQIDDELLNYMEDENG